MRQARIEDTSAPEVGDDRLREKAVFLARSWFFMGT